MTSTAKAIAIIGSSFRFPGYPQQSFAEALLQQKDLITQVDPSRWNVDNFLHPDPKHPGTSYTFAAGTLGDISGFDASFFGLSPREVMHIDPQQRYLLEMTWEAIESAGYAPSSLRGKECGVYMGVASIDYGLRYIDDLNAFDQNTGTGTTASIAANRVSYLFDFQGPSLVIDTACSSSLVAFHHACEAIRRGEVSIAMAGGVSLHMHPYGFIAFAKASMLSRQGRCRVFDASADGYVRSEGGGVLFLKDYDQAVADGDPIIAVVAASAANADGYKSALTIPNPKAQKALMKKAYAAAGISPDQITYMEAHGTGTPVGDPIEARAIGEALGQSRKEPLLIGSVKSNVGHLETASGMAGLAKALTCIQTRTIPATIGIQTLNPAIPFDELNLKVVTENRALPKDEKITIGINSFGFGGANAHVILQSPEIDGSVQVSAPPAKEVPKDAEESTPLAFYLSAHNDAALKVRAQQLHDLIQQHPDQLYNMAWSLRYHRERHATGVWIEAESSSLLLEVLSALIADQAHPNLYKTRFLGEQPKPVFVYSGNGCQWAGMGKNLLQASETFRQVLQEVDQHYQPLAQRSLIELIEQATPETYHKTEWAQPALFAIQVGITQLFKEAGITPSAVTGHSVGEVAAAWASGALSLKQAVEVIFHRSQCQGKTAGQGQMTAVALSLEQMQQELEKHQLDRIAIAGINSGKGVTLAGDVDQLELIEAELKQAGVRLKRLDLDYAFHSPTMDSIEADVKAALAHLNPSEAQQADFYSTVAGDRLSGSALTADYWWKNIRKPVLFNDSINKLVSQYDVFVEIGAHPILTGYIKESGKEANNMAVSVLPTLSRDQDQLSVLKQAIASIWSSGADVDWSIYFPVEGQRFNLPAYPWQRESFMTPKTPESLQQLTAQQVHPLLGKPLTGVAKCWENHLDLQLWPWLAEHKIGEAVLFPGSGFIELALAAAFIQEKRHVLEIEELEIRSPLLLNAAPSKKVRTRFEGDQGKFVVESRDFNTSDDFTQHLKGRLLPETAGLCLLQSAEPLPLRFADISREALNQAAASAELFYGESFQCIAESWHEGDSIIGRVEPRGDAAKSASDYLIHPGVLDSAFQLVMALLYLKGDTDVVYVPVQVGRLQWHYSDDPVAQARVTLKRQLPHSLLLDVGLYDEQGNCLVFLQDVRMRAAVLKQNKVQAVDQLTGVLYPMPLPKSTGVPVDLQLTEQKLETILEQDLSYQSYVLEVEALLDSFAEQQLQDVAQRKGQLLPLAQRIAKRHDLSLDEAQEIDPQAIWFALLHDYPAHFALVQSLSAWYYSQAHVDQQDASKALDESGDLQHQYTQLLRLMLSETAHHDLANQVQKTLLRLQSELLAGQRLSVIEISGCEPWWAPWVFESIDARSVDYQCVTVADPSKGCASSLMAKYPALDCYSVQQWADKECASASLDCALVTLDLADLSVAKEMLEKLHQNLRPTGEALLMLHHPTLWLDCALAHHAQWWVSDTHTQQASWSQWRDLLQRIGFTLLQDDPDPLLQSGFYLIRVKRTEDQPVELYQPASDSHAQSVYYLVGQQLADGLTKELTQHSCRVARFANLHALAHALAEPALTVPVNLVLLPDAIDPKTAIAADRATESCVLMHEWAMKLANYPLATGSRVYVVTQGVAALFAEPSGKFSLAEKFSEMPDDVALWGFVRTLMNEVSQIDWRLIDLPCSSHPTSVVSDIFHDLMRELISHSAETEVVYTQPQARYVVRFAQQRSASTQTLSSHQTLTLGFQLPGQLRNLAWQLKALPELAADEVLVQVKATGLNFRDVMYALGLLSDEAIENGYSGPTLGLEFAGEVLAVGSDEYGYEVGDEVVGFGPASFSTQLIAKVSAISALPEGMTYEAAATIPTTFFTAWYALKHCAQLQASERILIHGAAGGVGIAAIQIAQALGAEIYATAGSDEKRAFLSLLGVEHIYDSRSNIFAEQILATTQDGQGVDVVLNSLAGESIAQNLRALKPFGRFLELGKRDFYENTPMGLRPFRNNLTYFGIDSDQLMKVKPELTTQLFKEVMQQFRLGQLFPLPYTLFTAERVEEAFRFMQQAKQIGKVVVTYPRAPKPKRNGFISDESLTLNDQGIYLVTGGLSGFGFRTAQWLVEKGVTSLALISRSGQLNETVRSQLNKWQRQGINVQTAACDITDAQALKRCLDDITQDQPLIGIVHAAAVYDDGLVQQLSAEQIKRVMSVKIQGAINLQQLSDQLQLFVLFSSATTLFGNPGQSHYVAANYWLEGFAAWRRQQGLAATCVNWGPINDVGYLSRETQVKEQLNSRLGTDALNSVDALKILEQMLFEQRSGVHALYLDWSSLSRYLPSADQPKFAELNRTAKDKGQGGDQQTQLQQLLSSGELKEAEALLIAILTTELSNILLLPESRIDATQPIYDLGFDSLMAAELMAAIDASLGVKLPVMALNDTLTLYRLADLILEKLNPQSGEVSEVDEVEALKSKHGEAE